MSLSIVFPGQGSQSVGMLADAYHHYSIVRDTMQEASDVLGYDMWKLISEDPESKLNTTEYTQPALMAADIALWRVLYERLEDKPTFLAGHSLGEFVAWVAAGALTFADALYLVQARGRFMQASVPQGSGAMAAIIGLDDAVVIDICEEAGKGDIVSPANYNSIGQVVIAGQLIAVERAVALASAKGARMAKLIPVSVPSHCELMQPAADKFKDILNNVHFSAADIPVIQNVDALVHSDIPTIKNNLVQQLTHSVQWVKTIQVMSDNGVDQIIECGPGKVLRGLIKRINKQISLSGVE